MDWTVFLDESGTDGASTIMVMSGAIFSTSEVELFETAWSAVLQKHQAPHLHCSELFHSKRSFREWTTLQTQELLNDLKDLTEKKLPFSFTAVMRKDDYREIYKPQAKGGGDAQLIILFRAAMSLMANAMNELKPSAALHVVYEAGARDGPIRLMFRRFKNLPGLENRFSSLRLATRHEAIGLQVADMLAYGAIRQERVIHGIEPSEIEHSPFVLPANASPPKTGSLHLRLPVSREILASLA